MLEQSREKPVYIDGNIPILVIFTSLQSPEN
jgi:hypothetical protein